MSMTKREKVLAAATVFVVAFGLALTQARSRLEAIRTKSGAAGELAAKIQMQRELIGAAADWAARYDGVKDQMPVFERGRQVDTYWLNIMDLAAEQYGVKIRNRSAKQETVMSDVCEFPIEVREWEATLEAFVKFVHAIQSEGAMLDMREMRVAPLPNRPGILKGSFTLYCAYMRGDAAQAASAQAASAQAVSSPAEASGLDATPPPAGTNAPAATSPAASSPSLDASLPQLAAPDVSNTPPEGVEQESAK